jgi:holliday junction DNA helicase RuvA
MIAYLKGTIISNVGTELILDVNGVGYAVNYMTSALVGQGLELYIHTVYREGDVSLWGFIEQRQATIFKSLMSVSGVGPRTAFALINLVGANELIMAISRGDHNALRVPGVGEKIAKKLILDLQGKLEAKVGGAKDQADKSTAGVDSPAYNQALQALVTLGYKEIEAKAMLQKVPNIEQTDLATIIKSALQYR